MIYITGGQGEPALNTNIFRPQEEPMTEPISLLPDEQLDTVNERLRLIRRKTGLTFGTDAFLLAAFVRPQPGERAVDLGSGTEFFRCCSARKKRCGLSRRWSFSRFMPT